MSCRDRNNSDHASGGRKRRRRPGKDGGNHAGVAQSAFCLPSRRLIFFLGHRGRNAIGSSTGLDPRGQVRPES